MANIPAQVRSDEVTTMPADSAILSKQETVDQAQSNNDNGLAMRLFANLPTQVRWSLTPEQRDAITQAAAKCGWGEHEIDIRLSIPLLTKRLYFVLLGGEERRDASRRAQDRKGRPVTTSRNLIFLAFFVTAFTILGGLFWTTIFSWYLSS